MSLDLEQFLNQWRMTADAVLAVLLGEGFVYDGAHAHYDLAKWDIGISDTSFPPQGNQIATWRAISGLRQEKLAVHRTTVLASPYGASISQEWLNLTITDHNLTFDGEVFRTNAIALKGFGERYLVMKALDFSLMDLGNNSKDPNAIINSLMSTLVQQGNGQIEGETIADDDFFAQFDQAPERRMLTGVAPIDRWTGGITKGMVLGVVSRYKGRKTSLMLNVLLNLAEQGASCSVLMFESSQEFVKCQLLSMLAIRWLKKNRLYNSADSYGLAMYIGLDAKTIFDSKNQYKTWEQTRQHALREAMGQMQKIGDRLRIYSTGYKTGKLFDLESCVRILNYDKRRYGSNVSAVDHLQRIEGRDGANIYERMSQASNRLESFARREQVALFLLSQMNEKGVEAESESKSANVKGGGDFSAAVDYLITLGYNPPENERLSAYLEMTMFLSRYGAGGNNVNAKVEIDRTSGLLGAEPSYNLPI